jgi:hypothetical protein
MSDLAIDRQSACKRSEEPLPTYWEAICEAIVNLLAKELPTDCQSAGK